MVNVLAVIFLSILTCSVGEEEVIYTDIATFINELYPELIKTKTNLLELNQTITSNVWTDTSLYEFGNLNFFKQFLFDVYRRGELNEPVQQCLLTSMHEALESEVFVDTPFNEQCDYSDFLEMLKSCYISLISAEEQAHKLPTDFINENMWCSNDGDLPSCYIKVQKRILDQGSTIARIINIANQVITKAEEDYDKIAEECTIGAIAKLISMKTFVTESIQICLDNH